MPLIAKTVSELFALPEYERTQFDFLFLATQKLMEAKDDLYASIPKGASAENLPITQNTMPSGDVVENEPVAIKNTFTLKWEDIRSCDLGALAEQVERMADQRLAVVMPHFFDMVARTCRAAGTASDARGQPFSFELYLAGLAKIEMNFDAEGAPILPTLVVGPELAKRMASMPPWTPEQQKSYDDLIESKRKEFNARRRYRKLH
jgi:hypothetical protein